MSGVQRHFLCKTSHWVHRESQPIHCDWLSLGCRGAAQGDRMGTEGGEILIRTAIVSGGGFSTDLPPVQ